MATTTPNIAVPKTPIYLYQNTFTNYCQNYSKNSHPNIVTNNILNGFLPLLNPGSTINLPSDDPSSSADDDDALSIDSNGANPLPIDHYIIQSIITSLQNQNDKAYQLLSILSDAHCICTQRH